MMVHAEDVTNTYRHQATPNITPISRAILMSQLLVWALSLNQLPVTTLNTFDDVTDKRTDLLLLTFYS